MLFNFVGSLFDPKEVVVVIEKVPVCSFKEVLSLVFNNSEHWNTKGLSLQCSEFSHLFDKATQYWVQLNLN